VDSQDSVNSATNTGDNQINDAQASDYCVD
jgi:hypothetical protein